MPYALVQETLSSVAPEKLRRAFRDVESLVAQDADSLAKDAHGILVDGLSEEDARTLCRSLERMGLGTRVVDEDDLPELPPARKIRWAECDEHDFRFRHPEGTTYEMGWRTIIGVAAGSVQCEEWRTERKKETNIRATAGRGAVQVTNWRTERECERKYRPVADVFTASREPRLRIEGDKFRYAYLGDQMRDSSEENFRLLVGHLANRAESRFLNRGAKRLVKRPDAPLRRYQNMHAFEEELTWLFYRMSLRGGT